jgi:hypothetical protein
MKDRLKLNLMNNTKVQPYPSGAHTRMSNPRQASNNQMLNDRGKIYIFKKIEVAFSA